jgi:hypothetical protein
MEKIVPFGNKSDTLFSPYHKGDSNDLHHRYRVDRAFRTWFLAIKLQPHITVL